MPDRSAFPSAENYYAVALHEVGHWTGHPSRLNRDLSHPFGSEGYAREELRAELSSMIMGDELDIGYDPGQHVAYVGSWIRALEEDPNEIFRASADAEKISRYMLAYEQVQEQEQTQSVAPETYAAVYSSNPEISEHAKLATNTAELTVNNLSLPQQEQHNLEQRTVNIPRQERHYLAVPYSERNEANALGAQWDKAAKSWYVGENASKDALKRWDPNNTKPQQDPAMSPQEEFADAMRSVGLTVPQGHPVMDGKPHRVPVESGKSGARDGFYVGHLDGIPAGMISNNKTGEELKWKSKGYSLSEAEKAQLQATAAAKLEERAKQQEETHNQVADKLQEQVKHLHQPVERTPYLEKKGVQLHAGIYTDKSRSSTIIPAVDSNGKHWTTQYIQEDGSKRFAKGGKKEGTFHAIGGIEQLEKATVLVIAEGYATAATLAESSNQSVVAAFDSGNLGHVAKALHEKFPDKPIVIAGDNDIAQELERGRNPGKEKALAAAESVGGTAIFPVFGKGEQESNPKGFSDFNDLATKSILGKEGVDRQISAAIETAKKKQKRQQSNALAKQHERKARGVRL